MKKMWKRMIAMATAALMVAAMLPATVFAEALGTITITKHAEDQSEVLSDAEFSLYQVASISGPDGAWTYEVKEAYRAILGVTTGDVNDLDSSGWEKKITALAGAAVDPVEPNDVQVTGEDGKAVFNYLSKGVYLVKETQAPEGYVASKPFLVSVPTTEDGVISYSIDAEPKNQSQPIDKEVTSSKDAAVGDKVAYKVTTQMPNYTPEYNTEAVSATLNVYDTMDAGLSFNLADLKVTVGGVEVTAGDDTYTMTDEDDLGTKTFEIVFDSDYIMANLGKEVVVTYTATITEDAVYENGNMAGVTYNNNPGTTDDITTTEVQVYTYTIDLTKKGEDDQANGLNGAKFTLVKTGHSGALTIVVNGTKTTVEGDTELATAEYNSADGKLVLKGLSSGTYTLKEEEAPSGYTLLANPITITLNANANTGALESATVDRADAVVEDGTVMVTVENHKGFSLPATGGMGTYVFTIGGLVIMIGAAALLIASKKKRNA